MGRVSRYRKISKDDPFAPKRAIKVDETKNHAPSKKELNEEHAGGMTRSMRNFMKTQERMKRQEEAQKIAEDSEKAQKLKEAKEFVSDAQKSASLEFMPDTAKPQAPPEFEGMRDDETFYEFNERIKAEAKSLLSKRVVAETHKVEKRKEYFAKKREAEKRKKMGINSDDELDEREGKIGDFSKLKKDEVKFGEQADRPPIFKALPKGVQKIDSAIAARVKKQGLSGPLTAFKEKKKAANVTSSGLFAPGLATSRDDTPSTSVRKNVQSAEEKRAMELLRERVQAQYREMKAARLAQQSRPENAKAIEKHKKQKQKQMKFDQDDLERFQEMRPESGRSLRKQKREANWVRK